MMTDLEALRLACDAVNDQYQKMKMEGGCSATACSPLLVRLFNAGYKAGHHDTVEGQYTDIFEEDMETFHEEEVSQFLEENSQDNHPSESAV